MSSRPDLPLSVIQCMSFPITVKLISVAVLVKSDRVLVRKRTL